MTRGPRLPLAAETRSDASGEWLPKLARGDARALHQRFQFQPSHVRVAVVRASPGAETTVGAGNNVLTGNQLREAQNPLGNQSRMLNVISEHIHGANNQRLALG